MRSIFKTTLLSVLLLTSSNAKNLLDLATNGAINQGDVKILNNNEMKNIKGGYLTQFSILTNTQTVKEIAVIALPDPHTEIGMGFDANGNIAYVSDYGLCGLGVTNCYYNETTKTHLQQNKNRFEEYAKALMGTYAPWLHGVGYTVKREIKVSDRGTRYALFTYGIGAYNRATHEFHKINSSFALENNTIIKELRDNFKNDMEYALESTMKI